MGWLNLLVRSSRIAVVSLGSTSVHFTVARPSSGHGLVPVTDASVLFELGSTVDANGLVPPERLAELHRVLSLYVIAAQGMHIAPITVVATEPLRRASNAGEVLAAVATQTGGPVHVLRHEEEALLSLFAVLGGRSPRVETLVLDIGGGSSEYAIARPDGPPRLDAVRTGAARLTDAWIRHDPPKREEMEAAFRTARGEVAGTVQGAPRAAIMVGGTATNLLRLVAGDARWRSLTRARLHAAIAMLELTTTDEITRRSPIRPQRARILPGGAALAAAFLDRYGLDRATVSQASIREGVILAIARAGAGWRERLPELVGSPGDGRDTSIEAGASNVVSGA